MSHEQREDQPIDWERALLTFIDVVPSGLRWMLVGSAATALQGVDIVPGDVDILAHPDTSDADMRAAAATLVDFATPVSETFDLQLFHSSPRHPLVASSDDKWLLGRWRIGAALELARIITADPHDALIETPGRGVWEHVRAIWFQSREVPAVPLEIQLATMQIRGQRDREAAVWRAPRPSALDPILIARTRADRDLPAR